MADSTIETGAPRRQLAGTAVSLLYTVGGRALFVLLQVLLARSLGPEGFGAFSLAWTIAGIGIVFGTFGLPQCCLRYRVSGRPMWSHGYMPAGIAIGAAIAISSILGADVLADRFFGAPESTGAIAGLALSVPISIALAIWNASFKSAGRTVFAIYLTSIGLSLGPLITVTLCWLAGWRDPAVYAWAFSIGLLPAVAHAVSAGAALPDQGEAVPRAEKIRFAFQSAMIQGVGVINLWIDRLMVGIYSTLAQLGQYQAASQLSMIPMMLAVTVTAVHEAPLAKARDVQERSEIFLRAQLYQLHITVAGCLLGALTAPFWLTLLFGADFAAGGAMLAVLLLAQLVRAAGGPAITVLNLCGATHLAMATVIGSAAVNLALNFVLIGRLGGLGAAIAALTAAIVLVGGSLWACLARGLIVPLIGRGLLGVCASLASMLVVSAAAHRLLFEAPMFEAFWVGAGVVGYFLPMFFLDIYSEFDDTAAMLRSRVRR